MNHLPPKTTKGISFMNIKEIKHQNLDNLKKLVHKAMDFLKENNIHVVRHIEFSDKNDGIQVSIYLKESHKSYGFRFTIFHEEGLEVGSVHYRDHDFSPANCTRLSTILPLKKQKITCVRKFSDKAIQSLFGLILKCYTTEASKF